MTLALRLTGEPIHRITMRGADLFHIRATDGTENGERTLALITHWRLRKGKHYLFTVDALGLVTKVTKRNGHRVSVYS